MQEPNANAVTRCAVEDVLAKVFGRRAPAVASGTSAAQMMTKTNSAGMEYYVTRRAAVQGERLASTLRCIASVEGRAAIAVYRREIAPALSGME